MDAAIGELHTGPKYPLSAEEPESCLDSMWYALDTNKKERVTAGTWRSITRLTPGRWGSLAAHLGEGTSDSKIHWQEKLINLGWQLKYERVTLN